MEGVSGGRYTGRVLGGDEGIVVVVTVGFSTELNNDETLIEGILNLE
jgi:hypothetical protein